MNIYILLLIFTCFAIAVVSLLRWAAQKKKLDAHIQELQDRNKALTDALLKLKQANPALGIQKVSEIIDKVKLKDIMSSNVVSIQEDAPFIEVPRKMREFDIRHLPVVSGDHLIGTITERMLYKIRSPRLLESGEWYYDEEMLNGIILRNVMEKNVVSLHEDLSMGEALIKMASTRVGCIPIVGLRNNLIGVVTRKDILKVMAGLYLSH